MPYVPSTDPLITIGCNGVPGANPETMSFTSSAIIGFIFFKQTGTKTLNGFRLAIGNVAGTPGSSMRWEFYTSNIAGAVSSLVASGDATPASYTSLVVSGLSISVTGDQYYGIRIRNRHGTPASNSWNMLMGYIQVARPGWGMIISNDGGTTWDDEWGYTPPLQLSYSDGSRDGQVWSRSVQGFTSFSSLYNTSGSRFALAGIRLRPPGRFFLHRVVCATRLNGTFASAGTLVARVYRGTTLVATSNARQGSSSTGGNRYQSWYFSTPVLLEPDADYVVALGQSAATGGTAAHYWLPLGITYGFYVPTGTSDAGPWGIHTVTSTASSLSSWTIETTQQMFMSLGLTPAVRA